MLEFLAQVEFWGQTWYTKVFEDKKHILSHKLESKYFLYYTFFTPESLYMSLTFTQAGCRNMHQLNREDGASELEAMQCSLLVPEFCYVGRTKFTCPFSQCSCSWIAVPAAICSAGPCRDSFHCHRQAELVQTSLAEEELIQLAKTGQSLILNPGHPGRRST